MLVSASTAARCHTAAVSIYSLPRRVVKQWGWLLVCGRHGAVGGRAPHLAPRAGKRMSSREARS